MRIAAYTYLGKARFGIIEDGRIRDMGSLTDLGSIFQQIKDKKSKAGQEEKDPFLSASEVSFLASAMDPSVGERELVSVLDHLNTQDFISKDLDKADRLAFDAVTFLPPVLNPQKIICLEDNYTDYCEQGGRKRPAQPRFTLKVPSALVGSGSPIMASPAMDQADYGVCLAVIIGKKGKKIPEDRANDHISGYAIMNTISARLVQAVGGEERTGTADTFAPLGPYLVTREEIGDPHDLPIRCRVNGILVQESNTSHMIFKVPQVISFLSQTMTLFPGDIIATGTPAGVAGFQNTPGGAWLKSGDHMEAEIDEIGVLKNRFLVEHKKV